MSSSRRGGPSLRPHGHSDEKVATPAVRNDSSPPPETVFLHETTPPPSSYNLRFSNKIYLVHEQDDIVDYQRSSYGYSDISHVFNYQNTLHESYFLSYEESTNFIFDKFRINFPLANLIIKPNIRFDQKRGNIYLANDRLAKKLNLIEYIQQFDQNFTIVISSEDSKADRTSKSVPPSGAHSQISSQTQPTSTSSPCNVGSPSLKEKLNDTPTFISPDRLSAYISPDQIRHFGYKHFRNKFPEAKILICPQTDDISEHKITSDSSIYINLPEEQVLNTKVLDTYLTQFPMLTIRVDPTSLDSKIGRDKSTPSTDHTITAPLGESPGRFTGALSDLLTDDPYFKLLPPFQKAKLEKISADLETQYLKISNNYHSFHDSSLISQSHSLAGITQCFRQLQVTQDNLLDELSNLQLTVLNLSSKINKDQQNNGTAVQLTQLNEDITHHFALTKDLADSIKEKSIIIDQIQRQTQSLQNELTIIKDKLPTQTDIRKIVTEIISTNIPPPTVSQDITVKPSSKTSTNYSLLLRPRETNTVQDIQKELNTINCPPDIVISKLHISPIGVELRGASLQDKLALQDFLSSSLKTATVENKRQKQIRLIFHNATKFDYNQFSSALHALGFEETDIVKIDSIPSKTSNYYHWIVELPYHQTLKTLLSSYSKSKPNFLQIGLNRMYFKIYLRIPRCGNCQKLGLHPTSICKSQSHCVKCGLHHPEGNCTGTINCKNCRDFNDSRALTSTNIPPPRPTTHQANDSNCPSYLHAHKIKLDNILSNSPRVI